MSTEFEVGKRVVIKDKFRATIIGITGKKLEVIRDDKDEPTTVSASVCVKAKGRAPAGIAEKIAPFLKKSNKAEPAAAKAGKTKAGGKLIKVAKEEKAGTTSSKIKTKSKPEAEEPAPKKSKNKDAPKKLSKEERKAAKKAAKAADHEKITVAKKKNKLKASKKKIK